MKRMLSFRMLLLTCFFLLMNSANAQADNLLANPLADQNGDYWTAEGNAVIETLNGNPCFVLRNGGYFSQEIALPRDAGGKYVLFAGLASSTRIGSNGSITGLPYLYGYMREADNGVSATKHIIQSYMEVSHKGIAYEWFVIWGIFSVPENTGNILFFLKQAEQMGIPHNGSAARFDDMGVYLFSSLVEAKAFAASLYNK